MAPTKPDNNKQNGGTRTSTPPLLTNRITKSTIASNPNRKPHPLTSSKSLTNTKHKRRPGRPFKMASEAGALPKDQPQQSPSTSTESLNPVRRLSIFETLPVEIIDKIFLYSLEVNLPRASKIIARTLTSERIYRILILLAFWDDHSRDPLSPALRRILAPVDYKYVGPILENARRALQHNIFRFRWCTMDRLLRQVPTLMVMTLHRTWLDIGVKMEPNEQAALQRFMNREDDSILEFTGQGPLLPYFADMLESCSEIFPVFNRHSTHVYKLRISPMSHIEIALEGYSGFFSPGLNTLIAPALSLLYVPNYLLRGHTTGFTAEDVAFLEMLRMTSKSFKHQDCLMEPWPATSINRPLLHKGVTKAIETKNYNAMISLLKLDEYHFSHARQFHDEVNRPYSIPSEHFIDVTRVGRENPSLNLAFFEALIRTSAESVPRTAPEILQWIFDGVQLGKRNPTTFNVMVGNFAKWLSDFMLTLPSQPTRTVEGGGYLKPLFNCGELDLSHWAGCIFAEEVLAPHRETLGNWTLESTFRLDGLWVKKDGTADR